MINIFSQIFFLFSSRIMHTGLCRSIIECYFFWNIFFLILYRIMHTSLWRCQEYTTYNSAHFGASFLMEYIYFWCLPQKGRAFFYIFSSIFSTESCILVCGEVLLNVISTQIFFFFSTESCILVCIFFQQKYFLMLFCFLEFLHRIMHTSLWRWQGHAVVLRPVQPGDR